MSLFGRKRSAGRGEGYDYWITATELMSAVMLIFVLIGLVALLRAKDEEQETAACEGDLKICNDKLGNAESIKAQLAACQLASKESQDALVSCVASLAACQAEKDAIISTNQQCAKLRSQREEIDRAIRAFLNSMGLDVDAAAGVVKVDTKLLFTTGSDVLRDEGKAALNALVPKYAAAIMRPDKPVTRTGPRPAGRGTPGPDSDSSAHSESLCAHLPSAVPSAIGRHCQRRAGPNLKLLAG